MGRFHPLAAKFWRRNFLAVAIVALFLLVGIQLLFLKQGRVECIIEQVGGRQRDDYGAWPCCTNLLPPAPVVYSFGIGGDASFDVVMAEKFNARVHCYDPTITNASFNRLVRNSPARGRLSFSQVGLGNDTGVIPFFKSKTPGIGSLVSTVGLQGYDTSPKLHGQVLPLSSFLRLNQHRVFESANKEEGGRRISRAAPRLGSAARQVWRRAESCCLQGVRPIHFALWQ
jgi:hypothetical protein